MKYKLVLENGKEFLGLNFGSNQEQIGELFFHTSMVGYQDLLSDPMYYGKLACMTYPLIGNYGLADDDYDFKNIFIKGYVVKDNNDLPSNFRSTRTLSDAMEENHVSGIKGVDTREITKIIRDNGIMKAMIASEEKSLDECLKAISEYQVNDNPTELVSCKKTWYCRTANPSHTVVILDLGIKTGLVKRICEYGLNTIVVPYNSSVEQIRKLKPNGIIISSGPANPSKLENVINLINSLKGKLPILGLGLGACLIALAYNGKVSKMKHGHQGANLPVRNLKTGKIEITSQAHFYQIDSLGDATLQLTYQNVIDNDIEGFVDTKNKIIGVQYLPIDTLDIDEDVIRQFIKNMK